MIEIIAICVLVQAGLAGYVIGLAAAPKPSSPAAPAANRRG